MLFKSLACTKRCSLFSGITSTLLVSLAITLLLLRHSAGTTALYTTPALLTALALLPAVSRLIRLSATQFTTLQAKLEPAERLWQFQDSIEAELSQIDEGAESNDIFSLCTDNHPCLVFSGVSFRCSVQSFLRLPCWSYCFWQYVIHCMQYVKRALSHAPLSMSL